MCPVTVAPFHSFHASPLNTAVLRRSWLGNWHYTAHRALCASKPSARITRKGGVSTVADGGKFFQCTSTEQQEAWWWLRLLADRHARAPVQGFDNQNGGRSGFDECHFGHAVMAKCLENRTVKSLCVRNFRRSYALALWGKWRRREGVQIIGRVRKIGHWLYIWANWCRKVCLG